MRLIALETATEACSAALWLDGDLRWLLERSAARRHGELILNQVDRLLAEAGLAPTQLDAVAVGRGPGAFTGVRLGLGVAQGLAFAIDRPVVPVSTLAALAQQGADRGAEEILALLDARMAEVYWALLEVGPDGLVVSGEERISAPDRVRVSWSRPRRMALGSGAALCTEVLRDLGLADADVDPAALPCAREVALLGAAAYARGGAVSAERAQPVYLRDRVAEPKTASAAGGTEFRG
ncbi:Inactive metal-dependent protease - like protein, putative molecular chaperone [Thioalkalivibrio nitratireducens DSM 14787]|uniref:tRNA threonylcarbamoyladenosine biosynthesis protein TsaB n=1 Tax=Thioalkalivibrio nitratireducens (strain DSM 14787 / UNIQEM 213 / ALEN2) TaxID=1255043 RepID=L0E1U0_THIND|nr:tRNA (adenosine(37)-N6)-threonylcarbamoyltransferase complex dimerization subunit type 1 TsaB [Thioalkalivibrio nitratireducens]AGA34601.1 Inactive metal-dependent protease - like protein, putative molecular chaperone [Thioalkalivibrio nitratireducens DSM 14787]